MANDCLPITGLCIVEQICPTGYVMIDKCEDNPRTEADLWKDHIFAKKIKRFLCITRVFPLAGGTLNNVLVDIYLHEEKDPAPTGYSTLSVTQDNSEPALKKKQLSVKLVPRTQATDAINDIQFLCKQKKAPMGYTLVGDLNGLLICYRVGKVQQTTAPPVPPRPQQTTQQAVQEQYTPYSVSPLQSMSVQGQSDPLYGNQAATVNVMTQRQQSRVHPLSGVPFEINAKLTADLTDRADVGNFTFRSRENIMHEFDYPFLVERQAQQTSQHYNGIC